MYTFAHLHVHTEYSILDGLTKIPDLIKKAYEDGQRAMAITDHGNMYGIFHFIRAVEEFNKKLPGNATRFKAIIGCEAYVAARTRHDKTDKIDRSGRHLILLAKNMTGYRNLSRMVSLSFSEGMYYKPRIDKELLRKYHEGIIACSGCIGGELAQTILKYNNTVEHDKKLNLEAAGKVVTEFKEIFGDDYYLELQRNGHPEQNIVNQAILQLSEQYQVKYIATNDVHFLNRDDADTHRMLICINTGHNYQAADSVVQDVDSNNGMAYSGEEYFRTSEEMRMLFADIQEAIENTQEIVDKVEILHLSTPATLPKFDIPESFSDDYDYLEHLVREGAKRRYPKMSQEIGDRINFELETVKKMGFPGYFLIVWDFINAGKKMGIRFGPGRGSAAGSVLAYCMGITNIDPIKYGLLFERFLNPDRISMPDMDIDIDDIGRQSVIDYVIRKYGAERVAQIITFNYMGAKSAIRNCARVMQVPLQVADRLAKMMPDTLVNITFEEALKSCPDLQKKLNSPDEKIRKTLEFARRLEGTVQSTGIHACGVIIGRDNLFDCIPLCTAKNSESLVTQYDGEVIEAAGLLKMDFLGLKTLSIIASTLDNIKKRYNKDIDIDAIPLDDPETLKIFSSGDTTAVFQFESHGMRSYLQELKPSRFEDIIAMNALYRPGPMNNIPTFINRKSGKEQITYPIPEMGKYLDETYGITVYQEQVMLLSRMLAGFTRGQADTLRKAMGKKNIQTMNDLKTKFLQGGCDRNYSEELLQKIWTEWEGFAKYAFNKSHSTCYAFVAFQTAYLKAHYCPEFLAANMTNNLDSMGEVSKFIDDAQRAGIKVLGPDVNESDIAFTVNRDGNIRYGLAALKGIGTSAIQCVIDEREKNGPFKNIFNFMERINLRHCNKRCIEALAKSGAFDSFKNMHRAQYFITDNSGHNYVDKLISFATKNQNEQQNQTSIFDMVDVNETQDNLDIPECEPWSDFERLQHEKEVAGFYISGNPLDEYRTLIDNYADISFEMLDEKVPTDKTVKFACIVTEVMTGITKNNKDYGRITLEDQTDNYQCMLFGEDFTKYRHLFEPGKRLFVKAIFKPRNWSSTKNQETLQYDLKPVDIFYLEEAYDKLCKSVSLIIGIGDVSRPLANQLLAQLEQFKGDTPFNLRIMEEGGVFYSDFGNFAVKINPERFVRNFKLPEHVQYKLELK